MLNSARTIIDVAGAPVGGARKILDELDAYFGAEGDPFTTVIGRNTYLTPRHLLARERKAAGYEKKVAFNNAGFALPADKRVTLLNNALHFQMPGESESIGYKMSGRMRAQIPVIRLLARLSDRLIVPCETMRSRVIEVLPEVEGRVEVKLQPVSLPVWAGTVPVPSERPFVLLPSHPASYKRLDWHAERFLSATEGTELGLAVTAEAGELGAVEGNSRIRLLGHMSHAALAREWRDCSAVYFPTTLESFGYPVAEGRCGGRYVIAVDSAQNRQIGADALKGYDPSDLDSLREAIVGAISGVPQPDPSPFDPASYFGSIFKDE